QLLASDVEEKVWQPDQKDPVLFRLEVAHLQERGVGFLREQVNREQTREDPHDRPRGRDYRQKPSECPSKFAAFNTAEIQCLKCLADGSCACGAPSGQEGGDEEEGD